MPTFSETSNTFPCVTIEPKILYFGTPVVLISTLNEDNSVNLAPMSSAWALGQNIILGLGTNGKTFENLTRSKECVLNIPSEDLWQAVERLAPLTGKNPVPESKATQFRYEREKFVVSRLTPMSSVSVQPPRVAECQLQFEGRVRNIIAIGGENSGMSAIEVQVIKVHADPGIVHGNHIDPTMWHPLIYNFRHYFGLGKELGKTFRAEL